MPKSQQIGKIPSVLQVLVPWHEVVIGLTTLAYRYEGLRREDFDEVLGGRISPGAGPFLWAITGNELTNIAWDFFQMFFWTGIQDSPWMNNVITPPFKFDNKDG